MKKKILTCPLTGVDFIALETADGNLIATNPITHEEVRLNYNSSCNRYYINPEHFKRIELVTLTEAAEILNISLQRVSKIAIDVLEYKRTRKVGPPRKEG